MPPCRHRARGAVCRRDGSVAVDGVSVRGVEGQLLTAPTITAHNTFAAPRTVQPTAFTGARIQGNTLQVALPARAIVMLKLR